MWLYVALNWLKSFKIVYALILVLSIWRMLNKTDQFAFGPFLAFGLATAIFLGDKMAVWYLQFGRYGRNDLRVELLQIKYGRIRTGKDSINVENLEILKNIS